MNWTAIIIAAIVCGSLTLIAYFGKNGGGKA